MTCFPEGFRQTRVASLPRCLLRPREPDVLYPGGIFSSPRTDDRDSLVRAPEAFYASGTEVVCPDCASLLEASSRTSDTGGPTRRCGAMRVHHALLGAPATSAVARRAAPVRALLSASPRSAAVPPSPACNGPERVR